MIDGRPMGWHSLFLWGLATAAGWGLSPFVVFRVLSPLLEPTSKSHVHDAFFGVTYLIFGAVLFGIMFAALQWLVLRRHITQASWWITATVGGLVLGITAMLLVSASLSRTGGACREYLVLAGVLVPGIAVGLLQRLVLKRHFARTWWWLLPSALTWPVSFLFALEWEEAAYVVMHATVCAGYGVVLGAISGITLVFISRKPKEESLHQ